MLRRRRRKKWKRGTRNKGQGEWKDGKVETWKSGNMEGWKDKQIPTRLRDPSLHRRDNVYWVRGRWKDGRMNILMFQSFNLSTSPRSRSNVSIVFSIKKSHRIYRQALDVCCSTSSG